MTSSLRLPGSGVRDPGSGSDQDVRDADASVCAAMAACLAEALAALLPEDPDLRSARLAVDDPDHLCVGHERGAREHFAAVLLEKQHLVESDFLADLGVDAVERDHGAGVDLDLAAAGLNDCEHDSHPPLGPTNGPLCFCAKELG